jgi:hypothetical protein
MVRSGTLIDRGTPGTHLKSRAGGRTGGNLEIEQKTNGLTPGSAMASSVLSSTEDYTLAAGSGNHSLPAMAAFAGSSRGFMAGCQAQELKASFPHSLLPFDTPADVSHYFACWSAQQTFTYMRFRACISMESVKL